ncbi:unnamed protein product [Paramecium sonneborni]|uniref:DUF4200 domain-containing protein n=1 Tax=Paramecium sonneborni TaxID=65129 RepID=A0A8S1RFH7_9CILI|nr:unnamed protein product [Paramecium sonneborni]
MQKKVIKKSSTVKQFDAASPATKLLEKRRKMYEIHEAYEHQQDEYKKQEEEFKKQEEQIREKDKQIQEELIKFCNFLQENEAKKKRALVRFQEEKSYKEQKEKEIQDLTAQWTDLQRHQQRLEKKVTSLKKYEDYLDSIIKQYPEQYHDLQSILDRYATLTNSNSKLVEEHQNMEKEFEKLKYESTQYEKEKNHEILQLNNDIKDLQKKLEEKAAERNQIQSVYEATTNDASSKNLSLGRILMAVDNLFTRCQEGTQRMKQDFEEYKQDKQNKEKVKDKITNNKIQNQDLQFNDEDNYELKSQQAAWKLKQIVQFMSDFKKIIDNCKGELGKWKEQKIK